MANLEQSHEDEMVPTSRGFMSKEIAGDSTPIDPHTDRDSALSRYSRDYIIDDEEESQS